MCGLAHKVKELLHYFQNAIPRDPIYVAQKIATIVTNLAISLALESVGSVGNLGI